MSCFNCGREGHVAKDCRQRPTSKTGVGRDTLHKGGVGRDTETENANKSRAKGWIRSGNDNRELPSNPVTTRRR
jgi:hypothetical protein